MTMTNDIRTSRASGYVLIRDGAPIDLGEDWPDAALATSDRSKCAVLTEADDGTWAARVLHGVSELEAIDSAEKLARDTKTQAAFVARLTGTIGKQAPASLWQRVRRVSAREEAPAKVTAEPAFKTVHCQIKSKRAEGDDLIIEGWANTENMDRDGEVVRAKAFEKTLAASLPSLSILFNHNTEYVCGQPLSVEIRDGGLWTKAKISRSTNPPQVRTWVEDGDLRAFSIRFIVLDDEIDAKGVRNITEAELLEISLVAMPSNRQSTYSLAKSLAFGSDLACTSCHAVHCECDRGIAFKRYPLATRDHTFAWGDAESKSILRAGGWDLLRDAHALYRPEKHADEEGYRKAGSYHLPHHTLIGGEMKTSLDGVIGAMRDTLSKAVGLSDEDRKGAYQHLANHLAEFGEAVPPFELVDDASSLFQHWNAVTCETANVKVEPETKMSEHNTTTQAIPAAPASAEVQAPVASEPHTYNVDTGLLSRMHQFINTPDDQSVDMNAYELMLAQIELAAAKAAKKR